MVILVKTLIYGVDVPGFPSLIISVMFFAGVQLISLGVIGEYLGRMYEEVKGRPLFLVAEELGLERTPRWRPRRKRGRVSGASRAIACANDHPLRRRLRPDRRRVARRRRAGGGAAAVGHQRDGHHAALAGDGPAPARAPRPPGHRPAPQSDARQPARGHAEARAGRHASRSATPLIARALLGLVDSERDRAPRSSASSTRFEKGLGFPPDHIDGHEHVHVLSGHPAAAVRGGVAPLSRAPSR